MLNGSIMRHLLSYSFFAVFGVLWNVSFASEECIVSTLQELEAALSDENVSLVKLSKTIEFAAGTYYLSASSTARGERKIVQVMEPFIPKDGKIIVENDRLISPEVVKGVNDYNLLTVKPGASVVISNLTLKGGFTGSVNATYDASTGGIDNFGTLHLCDCDITRTGTALLNRPGAVSVLERCNIVRNANWFGGGVLNYCDTVGDEKYENGGTVVMDRCSLTENQSFGSAHGGGAAENQGLMCLNNCIVANNSSTEIGGGINNCKSGTLYVMNSTLTGNVTTSDEYGVTAGGAIGNAGGAGHVYVVNSILSNNGYDTGDNINPVCIGRYEGSTDAHACAVYNTAIGAVAGMDRIDAVNTSSKVAGLFSSYDTPGIIAVGGENDGRTSDFSHPVVTPPANGSDPYALAPVMAKQETNHFVFVMSVPTYFDYSMLLEGTGKIPGMSFETNGVRTVLGPDVSDSAKLVEVTFSGDSRLEYNCIGAASVFPILDLEPSPDPSIFYVKLGQFNGGKVSGVTVYGDYYFSNSVITVHAEAASAYYLDGWIINGRKIANSSQKYIFSFHITSDTEITPVFMPVVTRIFTARQRYPWNNLVDIDYSVAEEDAVRYRIVFLASFEEGGTNRTVQLKSFVDNRDGKTAQRLGDDGQLRKDGFHRVTWDSAADGIKLKDCEVSLRILACEGDER